MLNYLRRSFMVLLDGYGIHLYSVTYTSHVYGDEKWETSSITRNNQYPFSR